ASWIIIGLKTIETRTHDRFKILDGQRVLIHAGQKFDHRAIPNPYLNSKGSQWNLPMKEHSYGKGRILGSAQLKWIGELDDSHSEGALIDCGNTLRYGLQVLSFDPWPQPFPVAGAMGIWYFDMERMVRTRKPIR
ncbi:MAG: hypothetical protein ACK40M_04255, partial [Flavobacteriales bacterium]